MKNIKLIALLPIILLSSCSHSSDVFGLKMDEVRKTNRVLNLNKEFVVVEINKSARNVYTQDTKSAFKEALDDALIKSEIFNGSQTNKVNVFAYIEKFKVKNFVQDITMSTHYYLKECGTNKLIYDSVVDTHVNISSMNGIEPIRRTYDRNILSFIHNMENSNISEPRQNNN